LATQCRRDAALVAGGVVLTLFFSFYDILLKKDGGLAN
jgi:hypothetical protein